MKLWFVAVAVVATACGSGDCVLPVSAQITSGSGTVAVPELSESSTAQEFRWEESSAPNLVHEASFAFIAGDSQVECDRLPWDALVGGSTVALGPGTCVVLVSSAGVELEASLSSATVTVSSTLDARGEGTVTFELDIPATTLKGTGSSTNEAYDVDVAASALTGTVTFAQQPCPSSGCSFNLLPGFGTST